MNIEAALRKRDAASPHFAAMAAATTLPLDSLADTAKALRDVAARMERGEKLPPEVIELAGKLVALRKAEDAAQMDAIIDSVIEDHAEILAALAK